MSKWGVLVLLTLGNGTARWGELRRSIDGISEKMLATTLKTLEGDGLVQRTSYPEVPPRVEYSLTELGCDLMLRLGPLMDWVAAHADDMVDREVPS
jgi:DNA-binding HxlR family transcriptional regulator